MRRLLGAAALVLVAALAGTWFRPSFSPETPLFPPPKPEKAEPIDWARTIETRIPPLKHERGGRWPLVLWEGLGSPRSPETARLLLARGIVPTIRLEAESLPAALILKEAGAPVIAIEGRGGAWPYSLAGEPRDWAHQYPPNLKVPKEWREMPNPMVFTGWEINARRIRADLLKFREAGVALDAAWLDWEVEPQRANLGAARWAPASKALLPPGAAADPAVFVKFRYHLSAGLLSAYAAAPIREVFPKASVTNWMAVLSSKERPVPYFTGHPLPPSGPSLLTASNPVAYGIDLAFLEGWKEEWPQDRGMVERFWQHVLLRQVSADTFNRRATAPHLDSFPWVARWVRVVEPDPKAEKEEPPIPPVPVMGREAYRDVLRHLWLRGIDGMQVFNSSTTSDPETAVAEVEDTQAVYDEMLGRRAFLEGGEVMNLEVPAPRDPGPFWSGLRLGDKALVRVTGGPGGGNQEVTVEAWPRRPATLPAPPGGATYLLEHRRGRTGPGVTRLP